MENQGTCVAIAKEGTNHKIRDKMRRGHSCRESLRQNTTLLEFYKKKKHDIDGDGPKKS